MINKKICLNLADDSVLYTNKAKLVSPNENLQTKLHENTTTSTLLNTSRKDQSEISENLQMLPKRIEFENELTYSKKVREGILENVFKIQSEKKHENFLSQTSKSKQAFSSDLSILDSDKFRSESSSSNHSFSSCKEIASKKLTHYLIPSIKRNDEKFKKRAISNLRKPYLNTNKSVNFKPYRYGRRPINYDGNITKFSEINYYKRRKYISNQKFFHSVKLLKDDLGMESAFNLFLDREIGFSKEWQRKIKSTTLDDDVLTDNEQLELAHNHILEELKEGLKNHQSLVKRKKIFNF